MIELKIAAGSVVELKSRLIEIAEGLTGAGAEGAQGNLFPEVALTSPAAPAPTAVVAPAVAIPAVASPAAKPTVGGPALTDATPAKLTPAQKATKTKADKKAAKEAAQRIQDPKTLLEQAPLTGKTATLPQMKAALQQVCNTKGLGVPVCLRILKQFGGTNASSIAEQDFFAVSELCMAEVNVKAAEATAASVTA